MDGLRVALVPTMGNLHEGHLSLIRLARGQADVVVVSNFVNPTQFGPGEDYTAYPRTPEDDERLAAEAGADWLFQPQVADMYPEGESVRVVETRLSKQLCGKSRPGHFDGVCTIVLKLFNLALPHVAVFGEKDAQQLRIIRRMAADLCLPIRIVAAPISREADGLARSSRNQYLTPDERRRAPALHHALQTCEALFIGGERRPAALQAAMRDVLVREAPLGRVDYAAVVDNETLEPVEGRIERPALAALAVWLGKPRLIDNTVLIP